MQHLYSNQLFTKILENTSYYSEKLKNDDLLKNLIGLLFGSFLVFGVVSLSTVFSLLTFGLLLYTIRQIMFQTVEKNESHNELLNLNYMWVSLVGLSYSYNFLWVLFNMFGGYLLVLLLNIMYTVILTKMVNNLGEWFNDQDSLKTFNMKEFELKNDNAHSEFLLSHVNFSAKLYTINSKFLDEIVLRRGSKYMNLVFNWIKSGSFFANQLLRMGYLKLYEFSQSVKSRETSSETKNESQTELIENKQSTE